MHSSTMVRKMSAHLLAVLVLALVLGAWFPNPAIAGAASEEEDASTSEEASVQIEGSVQINDKPAWEGINVEVTEVASSETCGTGTLLEGGRFTLELSQPCISGSEVQLRLPAADKPATSTATIPADPTAEQLSLSFQLSPAELELLVPPPGRAGTGEGGATETALVQQTESVFDQVQLMLISLLIAGAVVLIVIVTVYWGEARRRYAFRGDLIKQLADRDVSPEVWAEAAKLESDNSERRSNVFRYLVEGLVMSFVVIALVALGAAGKITQEGIVSVLAAMVGYAAGRATS